MRNEKMFNELEYIQELLTSVWPEWKVTKRLGKGTYGAVYEIVRNDLGSNYQCALKVLQMRADETSPDNTANTADFRTEYIYGSPYRPLSMSGAGTAGKSRSLFQQDRICLKRGCDPARDPDLQRLEHM